MCDTREEAIGQSVARGPRGAKLAEGWQSGFQNAFDQAAIGMALVALDGSWLRVNPALCSIVGYSEQELLAINFQQITHPDDLAPDLARVGQMIRGEIRSYQMEKRYIHKAGYFVWVLLSVTLVRDDDDKPLFFFGQMQDITERKRVEDALRDSDKRFQLLLNNSPTLIFIKDLQGRYLVVNNQFERALRVSLKDIKGKSDADIFPPAQAKAFRLNDLEVLKAGTALEFEEVSEQEDGLHTSIVYKFPLLDAEGKVYAIGGIATDITERKRAAMALERSEARYRDLLENTAYGVYHAAPDGKLLEVNQALVNMLGYSSKEELLSRSLVTDIYRKPEDRARLLELSRGIGHSKDGEVEWKRKDGKLITVRITGRALQDESGQLVGTEGIVENLTEWRELERQFRHSQKMEAIGRLAGGVAHDFNNLLTVISGHTEMLSRRYAAQVEGVSRNIEQIQKAADRAASLTGQLLAFSRMQMLAPKVLDVNHVLAGLDKILPSLLGEQIELTFMSGSNLGRVKADPGQIEQVIMNLAVNARDAMPDGGKLVVETRNFIMDAEYARAHPPAVPGNYVMVAVSDTGHGIDAETQSHIFEPFFTTKEKGTGLGLATVYGIIKQSGGFIWVYSEPGHGTRFEICLPAVDEPLDPTESSDDELAVTPGKETLLLVEDEESLRDLGAAFLREAGYRVLVATDGRHGLQIATEHQGAIDLLVTDIAMPNMGGLDLAARLTDARPEMKVLYLSGHPEYLSVGSSDRRVGTPFLQKPFGMDLLAKKVRETLGNEEQAHGPGKSRQDR